MKHLLLYLITLLVICFSVNAEMVHRESKNEFKGTTSHYIKSKMVAPNKPLSFPYENTKSALHVGCKPNDFYWAYVVFNKVNLTDGNNEILNCTIDNNNIYTDDQSPHKLQTTKKIQAPISY